MRFAIWLEANGAELIELDEVLGYHLEQAARYRRELGRPDAQLERAAGTRLAAAGARAALRSDAPGAVNLLSRATGLLPEDDPGYVLAVVGLVATLEESGGQEARSRMIDLLESSTDRSLQMHGRVARLQFRLQSEPIAVTDEAERATEEALDYFAETGDDLGLAQTYYLLSWTSWLRSRAEPAREAQAKVVEHAARAGAEHLAERTRLQEIGALSHGPFTPTELGAAIANQRADTPQGRANALWLEAELGGRGGRYDDAIARVEEAQAISAELGLVLGMTIAGIKRAQLLAEAGRLEASELEYRAAAATMEELGHRSFLSTILIELGIVLYELGRPEEAERLAVQGEELGATEDVVNFAWGRGLRARIAADRNAQQEAERLARDGLRYAYETDFPLVHATAHESLAYVLEKAGRPEARAELERSLVLWERYGFVVRAERTRALLAEL